MMDLFRLFSNDETNREVPSVRFVYSMLICVDRAVTRKDNERLDEDNLFMCYRRKRLARFSSGFSFTSDDNQFLSTKLVINYFFTEDFAVHLSS